MKRIVTALFVAVGLLASGCSVVTSGLSPDTTVTGEVWYTKMHYIPFPFFIPLGSTIHYCPPPTTPGVAPLCIEAEIVN